MLFSHLSNNNDFLIHIEHRQYDCECDYKLFGESTNKQSLKKLFIWAVRNNSLEIVKLLATVIDPSENYNWAIRIAARSYYNLMVEYLARNDKVIRMMSEGMKLVVDNGHFYAVRFMRGHLSVKDYPFDDNDEYEWAMENGVNYWVGKNCCEECESDSE